MGDGAVGPFGRHGDGGTQRRHEDQRLVLVHLIARLRGVIDGEEKGPEANSARDQNGQVASFEQPSARFPVEHAVGAQAAQGEAIRPGAIFAMPARNLTGRVVHHPVRLGIAPNPQHALMQEARIDRLMWLVLLVKLEDVHEGAPRPRCDCDRGRAAPRSGCEAPPARQLPDRPRRVLPRSCRQAG